MSIEDFYPGGVCRITQNARGITQNKRKAVDVYKDRLAEVISIGGPTVLLSLGGNFEQFFLEADYVEPIDPATTYYADKSCSAWNRSMSAYYSVYDMVFSRLCDGTFVASHWELGTGLDKHHSWKAEIDPRQAAYKFYREVVLQNRQAEIRLERLREEQYRLNRVPKDAPYDLYFTDSGLWRIATDRYDESGKRLPEEILKQAKIDGFDITKYGFLREYGKPVRKVK
jgi:hypothetical protein